MSEKYYKTLFDYIVLLRPTSPFREKLLIERGLKKLNSDKLSTSIRSVIETNKHPYRHWKIVNKRKMNSIISDVKEPYNIPRQQLPKMFFQTGDIEIVKRTTIMNRSISGTRVIPLIVKSYCDIDTIDDIKKIK
jgi:CMP-N,N'-diacetyllegionaminic acid synthase